MTKEGIIAIVKQLADSLKKLNYIKNNYTLSRFISNQDVQDAAKWNFYLIAQDCLDIGSHVISEKNLGAPESYEEILIILKEKKIISPNLFKNLRGLAGFRNRLAHGYFKLEPELLFKYLEKTKYIKAYLKGTKEQVKL